MSEWKETTLKEVTLKANTGLDAITRAPIVDYDSGIKCLRIQDVSQVNKFDDWGFCDVTESNYQKFSLKAGDVLIARTGNTIGVNIFIDSDLRSVFNNGLIRIKANTQKIQSKFLYYLFKTRFFEWHIKSIAYGTSTQPNMQIESLLRFSFDLPPLDIQDEILKTLSCLDAKIENLRRQNETLEKIAQTLFKHWFIDFEFPFDFAQGKPNADGKPYKSSGGVMVPSELGDIPEGWRVETLGNLTQTITKGTTPTTFKKDFVASGINFIKAESITENHTLEKSKFAYIDEDTNLFLKRSIVEEKDILYTIAGTIGRYAMITSSNLPANTNQAVAIIRPDVQKIDSEYLLCYFASINYRHYLSSRIVQAVQANLSLGVLSDSPIIIPDQKIKNIFSELIVPIFAKKEFNQQQIQTLTKIRDSLLPKLMSGQIRVKE